jgi:hypothetical protein
MDKDKVVLIPISKSPYIPKLTKRKLLVWEIQYRILSFLYCIKQLIFK